MLKLWQQGLILLALPLVFNLAFTAILLQSMKLAENDSARERNSSQRLSHITSCGGAAIGATACTLNTVTDSQRRDSWKASFDDHFQTLKEHRKNLEGLLSDSPDANAYRQYVALIDYFCGELTEIRQELGESADLSKLFSVYGANRKVEHALRRIMYMNRDILRSETKVLDDNRRRAAAARQKVYLVVWLGLFLNVVIALILAYLFNKSAASRVKQLIEHTLLIGAGKSLTAPLSGSDEFAQVDKALNGMARALESAVLRERALIENAAEVICSISDDGRIADISRSCARIWGYEPSELIGTRLLELVSPDHRDETVRVLFTEKGGLFNFENRIKAKNGQLVDCAWSCSRSHTEKAVFCVIRDVTEHRRIEDMKKQFIAMVSHDLRSPLNSISAFLQVLLRGAHGKISKSAQEGAQLAQVSADRLIALVNELLELEKMQSGKLFLQPVHCRLADVFAECEASTKHLAESREIMVYYHSSSVDVLADPDRLAQVLVNLVSNAIRYSVSDSVVEVKAEECDSGFVKVSVCDEGPGIPGQDLNRLFEPFFQAAADAAERGSDTGSGTGTGLGLAICKQIIEKHGGTIGVTSQVDKGSRFWFTVKASPTQESSLDAST